MAATIWKGSISFGLVSVPVKLFTAVRDHDVSFHQYNRDTGSRIRYRKVDASTGDEVASGDIVKGWDADDGHVVYVEGSELDDLDAEASELLDILDFVDLDQIDPVFYDRPYNVVPAGEAAAKAYRLLVEAMTATRKVAIATFVLRAKQHLAALRVRDGLLVLSTMRFHDEVLDATGADGMELVAKAEVRDRELEMATQLIENLTTEFDPETYRDEHQERLLEFLRAKAEGSSFQPPAREERGRVIDLTAALERSLEKGGTRKAAPNAPATATAATATTDDYAEMTKAELYELAQQRDLPGRSSMTRDELVAALRDGDGSSAADAPTAA